MSPRSFKASTAGTAGTASAARTVRTVALLVLLIGLGLARTAAAQTGTGGAGGLSGTTTFTADDFRIVVQQTPGVALPDFDLQRFFNVANCQCNLPSYVFFTLSDSGFAKKTALPQGSIEFWIGLTCNDTTNGLRDSRCSRLLLQGSNANTMVLSDFATAGGVVVPTTTQAFSQNFGQPATSTIGADGGISTTGAGPSGPAACDTGIAFSQNIWALVTFSGDATYDVVTTLGVNIDLAPPPAPDPLLTTVQGGNEAVVITWAGIDAAANPDLLGYQVLCDRGGALQVFADRTFNPGFLNCATNPLPSGLDSNVVGLDAKFVCSPLLSGLTDSFRVKILENDVVYGVAVVAIDTHYNASRPDVFYGAPRKTLSFYDVYRNGDDTNTAPGDTPDPGRAKGGFCAVGGAGWPKTSAAGLAALSCAFALCLTRRSRRGRRPR